MTFDEALAEPEGPRRTAAVVAWIQGLYAPGRAPVLVGGAAVELFTGGAYVTGDLDFVGDVPDTVARRLRAEGFRRGGRHWLHEAAELFVEFPGSSLGAEEEAVQLEIGGHCLTVVSLEDLLVDRLGCWAHWQSSVDGVNAWRLLRARREELDVPRLHRRAEQAGFARALDALLALEAQYIADEPASAALEAWARRGPCDA